jgi:hypothetical protein
MTAPWWAALPPASTVITCGPDRHRLRWKDGRLSAATHPDADGELVLAALGGEEAECLRLIRLWRQHEADLEVLAIGPRGAGDQLRLLRDERAALMRLTSPPRRRPQSGTGACVSASLDHSDGPRHSGTALAEAQYRSLRRVTDHPAHRRVELLQLLGLGLRFQLRLSATVAAAWSGRPVTASDQSRLTAALRGRLGPEVADWADVDPGQIQATIHDGPGWGTVARVGATLRVALPASWLASVWAAGLARPGEWLVVEVTEVCWPRAQVLALRRPGDDPEQLHLCYQGQRWSVPDD